MLRVRKMVRLAHNNVAEQRRIVEACLHEAEKLTGPLQALPRLGGASFPLPSSSGTTTTTTTTGSLSSNPIRRCFIESLPVEEYERIATRAPHTGTLSGVTVAVTDAFEARHFHSKFGVTSNLIHRPPPSTETPLIRWLRRNGAQIVGKLHCHTPFTIEEAGIVSPVTPAEVAVASGACHYALTSSFLGCPGSTTPLFHDLVSLKPTTMAILAEDALSAPHPLVAANPQSPAIIARQMDDLMYLWQVYTCAVQTNTVTQAVQEERERVARREAAAKDQQSPYASLVEDEGNLVMSSIFGDAGLERLIRSDTTQPALELTVGVPASWITEHFTEKYQTGDAFIDRIEQLVHATQVRGSHKGGLRIVPLNFEIDLDAVLKAHEVIAKYQTAQAYRVWEASLGALSNVAGGLLDELPTEVVTFIFDGRRVTAEEYQRALRIRDLVVQDIEAQFRDVDAICLPIFGEPYMDSNVRSFSTSLPFSFAGNPSVSLRIADDLPVQVIGEMGRDTGLLEDTMSLLKFVGKGKLPRWWRRQFLGETDD